MIRFTCPKCRFSLKLRESQVNGRPACPECHRGFMEMSERDQLKISGGWRRRKTAFEGTSAGAVRNFILGFLALFVGGAVTLVGFTMMGRGKMAGAIFAGKGLVATVIGIILLIMGALGKKD